MKQKIVFTILSLILVVSLAACSTAEVESVQTAENEVEADALAEPSEATDPRFFGEVPLSTQLLLGTFKLEDTDPAVDAAQASELLPLWKAVKSLSDSDTTSSVELDALYLQIQETMTDAQLDVIADFAFDGSSMRTMMSELGLGIGSGGLGQNGEGGLSDMPAAGGGKGQGMGDGNPSPEQMAMFESMTDEERATAIAEREGGIRNRTDTVLLDPLIALLEERANQ
ncbi:MAG: hypothetical protein K8R77_01080 [Anaerolineaceae bacterium]|nr:hypothetical protein [Anaerolineaceae bacterium]